MMGYKLIECWVWEYILKHTSDVKLIKQFTESPSFLKDVPRLKQMVLLKELSFQVSTDLDMKKTLNLLEALHQSFEDPHQSVDEEAGVVPEDVRPSKGFKASSSEAPTVNVWKGFERPTLELREDLRNLLVRPALEEVASQDAKVIQSKLLAFIEHAWVFFGPSFLERTKAAIMNGEYKPQGLSMPLSTASGQNKVDAPIPVTTPIPDQGNT